MKVEILIELQLASSFFLPLRISLFWVTFPTPKNCRLRWEQKCTYHFHGPHDFVECAPETKCRGHDYCAPSKDEHRSRRFCLLRVEILEQRDGLHDQRAQDDHDEASNLIQNISGGLLTSLFKNSRWISGWAPAWWIWTKAMPWESWALWVLLPSFWFCCWRWMKTAGNYSKKTPLSNQSALGGSPAYQLTSEPDKTNNEIFHALGNAQMLIAKCY